MRAHPSNIKGLPEANPADPRRSPRLAEREMVVEYWDGVSPAGRGLRDVSEGGAYIYTTEKWYAGAMLRMIFHGREPKASITVLAQVVRQTPDGIALEFVFSSRREREAFRKFLVSLPVVAKKPSSPEPPEASGGLNAPVASPSERS